MLAVLMLLAAEPGLKDAEGVAWHVVHGKRLPLGGGMAEHQKHFIFRAGKSVYEVESSSFVQSNPTISGGTTWKFQITDGVFEAVGTTVRHERDREEGEGKRTESVQTLRWNGKTLAPK